MLLGICGSIDQTSLLKTCGAAFVEENVQRLLKPMDPAEAAFAENRAKAGKAALPVPAANCFLPGGLKSTGPEADVGAIVRYAETAFARAHDLGLGVIVYGSGGSRQVPDGWDKKKAMDQYVEILKELGPVAEGLGVCIVVEPLNKGECNFINSLAEGAEAVTRADHPHVRLLADFFHMLRDGEDPREIVKYGPLIRHMHLAEKETRSAPGKKGDDFRPFLAACKEIGYDQMLSWECGWDDLEADAPESLAYIRGQMKEVGLAV